MNSQYGQFIYVEYQPTTPIMDAGSTFKKLRAFKSVIDYRPKFIITVVILGAGVAVLEGVGLSFIYPIVQISQSDSGVSGGGPIMQSFIRIYEYFDIPFALGYLIAGVAIVMTIRFTMSFLVGWLGLVLSKQYEKHLRSTAFNQALDAEIEYYDSTSTDEIINSIITETRYSAGTIQDGVAMLETLFLILMYASVMFYIDSSMTLFAVTLLGGITVVIRVIIEPAVTVGSRVAEANESVQAMVQSGVQGIRDVKLFGLNSELSSSFSNAIEQYTESEIDLSRNKIAIRNGFQLSAALTIFALIYIGFTYTGLALGELGIFLIAMFQIAPKVSKFNKKLYSVEGNISHLIRTEKFLNSLDSSKEDSGSRPVSSISKIEFRDVRFSYDEEIIINNVSFDVQRGQFISFVGQSGAGKSTIMSLLARMYEPDYGEIVADGVNIEEYDIDDWRRRVAVVRQDPYIFKGSLIENITIGKRNATQQEINKVCNAARVEEFVDSLPDGYESELGDNGVRLSGGQRQRVALARALLKDADFLILDEATSDLDSDLERQVQTEIESMNKDYGIISIAHQLSTIRNADRIYTVDDGKIVESGTHNELINNKGDYAELHEIQSGEA